MTSAKFIDKIIRKWKIKLAIKKSIFWTTDFKMWKQLGGIKIGFKESDIFGSIHTPQNIIFVNLKANYNKKETERTILHELLHVKYPKLTERQLRKKIDKLLSKSKKMSKGSV